jgi:glycosyltransferase 2 family protein
MRLDVAAPPAPEQAAARAGGDGEPAAGPSRGRRRARWAIMIATVVTTVVFSYIALTGLDLNAAWKALQASNLWWLIPALVAFGLGNVARAMRWRSLFAPHRRPKPGTTLNAMMIGYLYNSIMPARAGEAARVVVLRQRSSAPVVEITGTVVLERVYDIVVILVIFFITEPWLPHLTWFGTAAIVALVLAGVIIAMASVLAIYGERPLRFLLRPLARFSPFLDRRLERTVSELAHGLSGLHHLRVAVEALAWTAAAWLFSILCAYLVMVAFHMHLPFAASVLVMVAIALGMILPSPPAAVGVFEGAVWIALRAYGVARSTALPYAVILHLVNLVPFLVVGAVLLHHNARRPARVRDSAPAPRSRPISSPP